MKSCGSCKHYDRSLNEQPCKECVVLGYRALWEDRKVENPYWERVCKLSEKQRAKGMGTYGQGLECNPASMVERIEHLQEELIDALMYCEWMKDKLNELGEKVDD